MPIPTNNLLAGDCCSHATSSSSSESRLTVLVRRLGRGSTSILSSWTGVLVLVASTGAETSCFLLMCSGAGGTTTFFVPSFFVDEDDAPGTALVFPPLAIFSDSLDVDAGVEVDANPDVICGEQGVLLRENPECRSNLQGKSPSGSGLNGFLCVVVVVVVFERVEVVCSVLVLDLVAGVERDDCRAEEEEDSMIESDGDGTMMMMLVISPLDSLFSSLSHSDRGGFLSRG